MPESGRSPGEGNCKPLQYSCLGNPTDREAWWAAAHGVVELDTTEWLSTHTYKKDGLWAPPRGIIVQTTYCILRWGRKSSESQRSCAMLSLPYNFHFMFTERVLGWIKTDFYDWLFWYLHKIGSEMKVAQSLCDPIDIYGILQARILEWVAFPFSRGSSQPRDQTQVSHIVGGFFTDWATREAQEY